MTIINLNHLWAILGGFFLTLVIMPAMIKIAEKFGILDRPNEARKIHKKPVSLLGGLAVYFGVSMVFLIYRVFNLADFSLISDSIIAGVFLAGAVIMIGGILDDKYRLRPGQQVVAPILAAVIVILSGLNISFITNPFGGPTNALVYLTPIAGAVITFFWLMGMMYTTKFLDGLDGLVGSISMVGGVMIFFLSLNWDVPMSATGFLALIFSGGLLAFLIFNWHPAKVFLGEGGSIWTGFILGVLSIISGSKIATTLLIVGIPALDVLWVVIQRLIKRESPFSHADRKHLHFQLLGIGFSQQGAVIFLCLLSLVFGSLAIFIGSFGKLVSLGLLLIMMVILGMVTYLKYGKDQ